MSAPATIIETKLDDAAHGVALVTMLEHYMRDPMEGGQAPSERVKRELVPGLRAHPACYVLLAFDGRQPVGFAICFVGFSTFNARPLINIHDIFVELSHRGGGIGKQMIDRIEEKGRSMNACALTLEVREDNHRARGLYRKVGFQRAEVGAERIPMEFWRKTLS